METVTNTSSFWSDIIQPALRHKQNTSTVTVTEGSIYHYTLSEPVQVQSGDIVGIMMPRDDDENANSIRPLFIHLPENTSDTLSCARRSESGHFFLPRNPSRCMSGQQQHTGYIPLISVVFGKFLQGKATVIIISTFCVQLSDQIQIMAPQNQWIFPPHLLPSFLSPHLHYLYSLVVSYLHSIQINNCILYWRKFWQVVGSPKINSRKYIIGGFIFDDSILYRRTYSKF